jgi:hypothetical protein
MKKKTTFFNKVKNAAKETQKQMVILGKASRQVGEVLSSAGETIGESFRPYPYRLTDEQYRKLHNLHPNSPVRRKRPVNFGFGGY